MVHGRTPGQARPILGRVLAGAASPTRMRVVHDTKLPFFLTGPRRSLIPRVRAADALSAAEGHPADDVVAVEPAMLEGRRDVACGDRQHSVCEPHVDVLG